MGAASTAGGNVAVTNEGIHGGAPLAGSLFQLAGDRKWVDPGHQTADDWAVGWLPGRDESSGVYWYITAE